MFQNQEKDSYKRKEQAYNRHLQRLRNHLAESSLQLETKAERVVEPGTIKRKEKQMYWNLWLSGLLQLQHENFVNKKTLSIQQRVFNKLTKSRLSIN